MLLNRPVSGILGKRTSRLAAVVVLIFATGLAAQSSVPAKVAALDATHLTAPQVLDGMWLIHAGDDPEYASPSFDDSQWTPFDPHTSLHRLFPAGNPGVIWYRQRIVVNPTQTGLALREETLARAFDIYTNGELLMRNGRVTPLALDTYDAPLLARIPRAQIASGTVVIAVRVAIWGREWRDQSPGLFAGNLTIGEAKTLEDENWLNTIGTSFFGLLDRGLTVALGVVALVLFIAQRRRYEYLWIFGLGLVDLGQLPVQVLTLFRNIPIGWRFVSGSFTIASPAFLVAMYFAFVNRKVGWKFRVYLLIAGVLNAYTSLANQGLLPTLPGSYGLLTNVPFVILLAVVVPIVLAIHWRRGNGEAGILLIPATLFSLFIYVNYALALLLQFPAWNQFASKGLQMIQRFPAGPFVVSLNSVSGIASTLALAVIMILRSTRMSRQQAVLEGELEAAREVQQVILPEQMETIPGFTIESAYEPAQQVGGDFFQIIPTEDGGLLLVLGDVAGKGLPAAMLVSVLVGAIRGVAEYTTDPAEMLANLNDRLIGRSRGGFSTAVAAHISRDGSVTIANAGHLSPYVDGRELELPGALPLGILSGVRYEPMQFHLAAGSRLTFYSDGVIEAQNEKEQLLGFERGRELSTRPASAIVETAMLFGQSDDITVVAILRNAAIANAA